MLRLSATVLPPSKRPFRSRQCRAPGQHWQSGACAAPLMHEIPDLASSWPLAWPQAPGRVLEVPSVREMEVRGTRVAPRNGTGQAPGGRRARYRENKEEDICVRQNAGIQPAGGLARGASASRIQVRYYSRFNDVRQVIRLPAALVLLARPAPLPSLSRLLRSVRSGDQQCRSWFFFWNQNRRQEYLQRSGSAGCGGPVLG